MKLIKKQNFVGYDIQIMGDVDKPYFFVKDVCNVLGLNNVTMALKNINEKYLTSTIMKSGQQRRKMLLISEAGLYQMVLRSRKPNAEKFTEWVVEDVLPSIRKTGKYNIKNKKIKKITQFKIYNEYDLQIKVVDYIRQFHPNLTINSSLGEMQNDKWKRIKSWKMGYTSGVPDLMIFNKNTKYNGLAIEFKTPTGKGKIDHKQSTFLEQMEINGWNCIISNDYDLIITEIFKYCQDIKYDYRLRCNHCTKTFKNENTLDVHNHIYHFEKYYLQNT
jgi:prophage antirepressor-like protein